MLQTREESIPHRLSARQPERRNGTDTPEDLRAAGETSARLSSSQRETQQLTVRSDAASLRPRPCLCTVRTLPSLSGRRSSRTFPLETRISWSFSPEKFPWTALWIPDAVCSVRLYLRSAGLIWSQYRAPADGRGSGFLTTASARGWRERTETSAPLYAPTMLGERANARQREGERAPEQNECLALSAASPAPGPLAREQLSVPSVLKGPQKLYFCRSAGSEALAWVPRSGTSARKKLQFFLSSLDSWAVQIVS